MDNKKPTPLIQPRGGKECPVCGKPSYSRDGIHPQCALLQADMPRQQKLAEAKKQKKKTDAKKVKQTSWKKKCPICRAHVHVRLKICSCGHAFH